MNLSLPGIHKQRPGKTSTLIIYRIPFFPRKDKGWKSITSSSRLVFREEEDIPSRDNSNKKRQALCGLVLYR
jgi:hypothetical protein